MADQHAQPPMHPLTPPDSTQYEKHDSFASVAQPDALFPQDSSSSSNDDVAKYEPRRASNGSRLQKRRSSSAQSPLFGQAYPQEDKENQLEDDRQAYERPAKKQRTSRTTTSYAQPASIAESQAIYEATVSVVVAHREAKDREVSPPSFADVDIFSGFLQSIDYKRGTWLQPTSERYPRTTQNHIADASDGHQLPASNKGRSIATPTKPVKPSKVRSQTPKTQSHARHNRKASNISDSHHGENKQSRGPPQKPQVSKDCDDWPDFTAANPSLWAILEERGMEVARQFGALGPAKARAPSDDHLFDTLHPAEQEVSMRVGLDANRFLYVKRAVFCGYLKHLLYTNNQRSLTPTEVNHGLKSWNKTAAQQTVSIDVNKVSKLYDSWWKKLGWFEAKFFTKYIENYSESNVVFPAFNDHGRLVQRGGYSGPE